MKLIHKSRIFKLINKTIKLPNKHIMNIDCIIHPGAALIIPFLTPNKIILIKQFRAALEKYIYELPAGTIDPNETALSCAKREIVEEIGYKAREIKKIGEIYPVPGYSTEKIIIFTAKNLTKVPRKALDDEVIFPKIVTKKEIQELFKKGYLLDAKTICAFTHIGWL